MTTPSNEQSLDGLIERAKAATGPDEKLDYAIDEWLWRSSGKHHGEMDTLPPFTASIDAALALVERCLPGQNMVLTRQVDRWFCVFTEGADHTWLPKHPPISGPTLPLVILLALLSAMVSNEETLDGL